MTWAKPWAPGRPQVSCTSCGDRCVASTLAEDGRCVQCVKRKLPVAVLDGPEPVQLALGVE